METVARQSRFVARVRVEMARQSLSVRGLARKMDPLNVDRARRNLHRWLDEGIAPGRASRAEVAGALGIEAHELTEAEDEESHQVASLTLDEFLRLRIEHHVSNALSAFSPAVGRV